MSCVQIGPRVGQLGATRPSERVFRTPPPSQIIAECTIALACCLLGVFLLADGFMPVYSMGEQAIKLVLSGWGSRPPLSRAATCLPASLLSNLPPSLLSRSSFHRLFGPRTEFAPLRSKAKEIKMQ
jgi:hypothetical protein